MLKRKFIKSKGKVRFSRCFQEFKEGERVAIVREHSFNPAFPKRIQGVTGEIIGKRGKAYLIRAKDNAEYKVYIMKPIHLKRIV